MSNNTSNGSPLEWRHRLEIFSSDNSPVIVSGPRGQLDGICNLGELTDEGRRTSHALGRRLRHLYVDQLHFMPPIIKDADMIYLRATPIPRAIESLQETFLGMYPSQTRAASFPPPTIITRALSDETLFPNNYNCRRFAQLSRAFAQRTADRWNNTTEMDYLNKLISKWMPETSKRVGVDSHPRLYGIMDTINATLAHGPDTRLPKEFYDQKGRDITDKIVVEEWFSGYQESQEYRSLGIGALMGDIVFRMVGSVEMTLNDGLREAGEAEGTTVRGRGGEKEIKLGLSGCHDSTLGAVLVSLGAFGEGKWPPYTSHVALELFRKADMLKAEAIGKHEFEESSLLAVTSEPKVKRGWFRKIFGDSAGEITYENGHANPPLLIARKKVEELSESERSKLDGYFVRVRYNDKPMTIPGCKAIGKHLDGDESFCTLEAFKTIVDKYTPSHWKQSCQSNIDAPAFPAVPEPAGY